MRAHFLIGFILFLFFFVLFGVYLVEFDPINSIHYLNRQTQIVTLKAML